MALTELEIRAAKAVEKPLKLFDGGGLYLLVTPGGGRWWRLKYRYEGKERGIFAREARDRAPSETIRRANLSVRDCDQSRRARHHG
jgi:hypothetical protein